MHIISDILATLDARFWLTRAGAGLVIVLAGWVVGKVIDTFIARTVPVIKDGIGMQGLLRTFCKALIQIIALLLILRVFGYNISALLAGLGLGGAALALASKDTLSNFFGSITVFFDRPFKLGDRIKVAGFDGTITEMGIRTSILRTAENSMVFIPNSVFAANPIENVSAKPEIKTSQTITVKTAAGMEKIEQAVALLKTLGAGTQGCAGTPQAGIMAVSGAACQISFTYFVHKDADYLATVNRVNLAILKAFDAAEIALG